MVRNIIKYTIILMQLFNFFILYFNITRVLCAKVWYSVLYLEMPTKVDLTLVYTIDHNGDVFEGIIDTFDTLGFYLIMLYSKNN